MINLKDIINSFIDKYKGDKYKISYFVNFKSEKNFIPLVNHYGVDINNINVEEFLLNDLNNRLSFESNNYIEGTCGCCGRLIKYTSYQSFLKSINKTNKNNCKHDAMANKVQMYIDYNVDVSEVSRNCPSCFEKIYHKNLDTLDNALFRKSLCTKCCSVARGLNLSIDEIRNVRKEYDEKYSKYIVSDSNGVFIRKCPQCFENVIHTNHGGLHNSFTKNNICKNCLRKKQSIIFKGVGNPYYGKKHSDSVRKKLSDSWTNPTEGRQRLLDKFQTNEHKEKFRNDVKFFFDDNPIKNSNFLEYWTEKYGTDEANRRWNIFISKQKINNAGENNSMYGKPSPQGSGNGWKGWYITNQNEKIFFRSITELSYFINIIERFNLDWTTGESQKYKIEYTDYEGKIRNYFPDYIIANKYIVECKPRRLWDSANVKSKMDAAIEFCKNNNMVYKIRDCRKTDLLVLFDLYNNERIIPQNDKYRIKFETYFKKHLE